MSERCEVVIHADDGVDREHAELLRSKLLADGFHESAVSLREVDSDDNLSRLEAAQRGLLDAVDTSLKASRCRNAAQRADKESDARADAHEAELKLILDGRRDLARRLEAVVTRDMTTPAARRELREVAQLIDAELEPSVSTDSFRAASDGGARE